MRLSIPLPLLTFAVACLLITGCRQEAKQVRGFPLGGTLVLRNVQSELQPGPQMPVPRLRNPFDGNAHAIAEGKKLYNHFNCSGCHANGGGAIGPALMDEEWIYGSAAENIFSVIVEGRPQGMPTYGTRISEFQVWQIVAFVRSMADHSQDTASEPTTQQARREESREVKNK